MSYRVPQILSFSDVARLDVCKGGSCSDLPFAQLLDIAYVHGLDIDKGYSVKKCLHRNLYKEIVYCEYLVANERLDEEWIKSGCATIEAVMAASGNIEMYHELQQLQNGGQSLEQYAEDMYDFI